MKIFKDIKNSVGLNIIFGEYHILLPLFNKFEYVKSIQDIENSKSNHLIMDISEILNTSDYRFIDTIIEKITTLLFKNNKILIVISQRKNYTHATLTKCCTFLDVYDEEIFIIKNRFGTNKPIKISDIKILSRTKKLKRILK